MTTPADTTEAPPPLPPPPPVRPRLERSTDDRYIGGVCGGLGRYFDVDPIIFRVALACMAVFGAGLVVYAVAWAFIPEWGQERSVAQATVHDGSPRRELLLIAVVVMAGFAVLGIGFGFDGAGDPEWLFPLFVIAGFVWWRRSGGAQANWSPPAWLNRTTASGAQPPGGPVPAPDAPPGASAFWAATATADPSAPSTLTSPAGTPPHAAWGYQAARSRPPRERSRLGRLTFSALLVALGTAALLDLSGAIDLPAQGFVAIALVVTGTGLLVGGWYGRSRGLIALGLLLTLAASTVRVLDVPLRGGDGEVRWQPTSVEQLNDPYHLRTGSAVIDLTALEFGEGGHTVNTSVGVGELIVLVPAGVRTRVLGHLGAGTATVFGRGYDGVDVDLDRGDGAAGTPQLFINVRMGIGELQVRHETS